MEDSSVGEDEDENNDEVDGGLVAVVLFEGVKTGLGGDLEKYWTPENAFTVVIP